MHREPLGLIVFSILCLLWVWWKQTRSYTEEAEPPKTKTPRKLRPRTPRDCPECRAQTRDVPEYRPGVVLWREVKSPRGRKKKVDTEGHACPNRVCDYRGIRDASIHALVGYGSHGQEERIQDFLCQACGTKVTERRDTPLYGLKTSAQRVGEVLAALAEGLDVAASERVFGHGEGTIQRWLTRAGMHAEGMHEHFFRDLRLWHVQLDELKTRLRKKGNEVWLWVALDVKTKVMAVVELGPRTQAMAHRLIHILKQMLAEGCVPVFTSDGLRMYFYALTAHWGEWIQQEGKRKPQWVVAVELMYGQVKKRYRRRRMVRVEYRVQLGTLEELQARLKALGLSGKLNTAFVKRVNLTLRQGIAPMIRRTWGTAQTLDGLKLHIEWERGYYHFIRPHMSLRVKLPQPISRKGRQISRRYRSRSPAMAAGVTDHRWTVSEFLSYPLPEAVV